MNIRKVLSFGFVTVTVVSGLFSSPAVSQDFRDRGYYQESGRRDYDRRDVDRGGCSPREALRQARSRGMYDTRIYSIDRRKVVVEGYGKRDEYTRLILANRRGCARIG